MEIDHRGIDVLYLAAAFPVNGTKNIVCFFIANYGVGSVSQIFPAVSHLPVNNGHLVVHFPQQRVPEMAGLLIIGFGIGKVEGVVLITHARFKIDVPFEVVVTVGFIAISQMARL